jgi:saccharopine dehydrogenase (NADP+, L-glutamate forming)
MTSTLLDYGDPKRYSSMAKLVGIPCGVAAQQVLDGIISTPGVLAPLNTKINGPLIETLKKEGIECKEEIVV